MRWAPAVAARRCPAIDVEGASQPDRGRVGLGSGGTSSTGRRELANGGEDTPTLLKDFKTFLLRGNVVDLAVAVVVGAAFGAVVTALVRDILTPVIAVIFGKHDFSTLSFTLNGSRFAYGDFINYLIAFLSVAAAVFFFVVQPVNALMARRKTQPEVDAETGPCSECLSNIPRRARRCAFCGSPQTPGEPALER